MTSDEVPEPWASAMIAAGFTDPRYSRDVPSRRALAIAADTTTSTISAMISGTRDTEGRVIQAVAVALGMEDRADEVTRWVGHARTSPKTFRPHRDADLLTAEEQAAVNEMIRLLAATKKRDRKIEGADNVVKIAGKKKARKPVVTKVQVARRRPAARKTGKPTASQRGETTD